MNEIIRCPSCQRKLQVPESLLGQDVQCPTCGATFVAALVDSPPPAPPPVPPDLPADSPRPVPRRRKRSAAVDEDDYEDDYDRPARRRDLQPHRGPMILALGIISLVFCGVIFGPMAWIMGQQDLNAIREGQMDPEGEGLTNAGRVCGILGTLWNLLWLMIICLGVFAGMLQDM
jgi:hypothetical protein